MKRDYCRIGDYLPHWFHDPTFTSAQSTEQGTNVNHISSGMYTFFQTRLFKSSGSKYLMRIMQFCNSVLLCKNKRNSHLQSTFWKLFKLFSILESNNWRKNITNVVPWDSVDIKRIFIRVKNIFFRGTAYQMLVLFLFLNFVWSDLYFRN